MASSSSADEYPCGIPAELARAVEAARPAFPFWGLSRGCRKGKKCPLRHSDCSETVHLPHVSRHLLEDGRTVINLRPPLLKGLERYFRSRDQLLPVSHGEFWRLDDGSEMVTYATPLMVEQDAYSCRQAEIAGKATSMNGTTLFASTKEFSRHLMRSKCIGHFELRLRSCWAWRSWRRDLWLRGS